MNILNKLNMINNEVLNESGIGDLKTLAKDKKGAWLYFHLDADGVISGICMKEYLKQNGIKVVKADTIQYGDAEYAINKVPDDMIFVLVDFAHGKVDAKIHTDHHDKQIGVEKSTLKSFVKTPSNASYISTMISPRDIFPPDDIKFVDMIDSANFLPYGVKPEDLVRAAFSVNPDINVLDNKKYLALVVNKLLLTFKSKPDFLSDLVMNSKPSLISMYNQLVKMVKERGYTSALDIEKNNTGYVEAQKKKAKGDNIEDIMTLRSGEFVTLEDGKIIVQFGGGYMSKAGSYDRYTAYRINPNADFLVMIWDMGLVQCSKNPFKGTVKDLHLGDIAKKVLTDKMKSKLNNEWVNLDFIKRYFESKATKSGNSSEKMGFTFPDLVAMFYDSIKKGKIKGLGIEKSDNWLQMIRDITNKPYSSLSFKLKDILKRVEITLWDIMEAQSGGHKSITNISGFNFYDGDYETGMKIFAKELAKELISKIKE